MEFVKLMGEIAISLSVVGAWFYVAVTLPDPARAATAPAAARAASGNDQLVQDERHRWVAQR